MKRNNVSKQEVLAVQTSLKCASQLPLPDWLKECQVIELDDVVRVELEIPGLMMNCYQLFSNGNDLTIMAGIYSEPMNFLSVSTTIDLNCETEGNFHVSKVDEGKIVVLMKRKI